jgi:hypothetical protein
MCIAFNSSLRGPDDGFSLASAVSSRLADDHHYLTISVHSAILGDETFGTSIERYGRD